MKKKKLRDLLADPALRLDDPALAEAAQNAGEEKLARSAAWLAEDLRAHHLELAPPTYFAQRVLARLPEDPVALLGWAALRLLPAAAAVILALGWQVQEAQDERQGFLPDLRPEALLTYALFSTEPSAAPAEAQSEPSTK